MSTTKQQQHLIAMDHYDDDKTQYSTGRRRTQVHKRK
jgi:hypothetical protein